MDSPVMTSPRPASASLGLERLASSQLVGVAREAFSRTGVDFLCFGESDHPCPTSTVQALTQALQQGHTRYPDIRGIPALRETLAHYLSGLHQVAVDESRIAVTASGMAALNVAFASLVQAGDTVVVIGPCWPNPCNLAQLRGARVRRVALRQSASGFLLDLEELQAMLWGAKVLVLNSPNNPTGWTASKDQLRRILAMCRALGVWVVSDEVYSRLTYDGRAAAPSMLEVADENDRLIVCNSFSKGWAMTGFRVGWLVLPQGQRDAIGEVIELTHSGVAPFNQLAAMAALGDTDFVEGFRAYCARGRAIVSDALAGLDNVVYSPPQAAFYAFLKVRGLRNSHDFALNLVREHGVALAPGTAFGADGEGYLRICFAQKPELLERAMTKLVKALGQIA